MTTLPPELVAPDLIEDATSGLRTGQARWRLMLNRRAFSVADRLRSTEVAVLEDARSRRLEQKLNAPATLTFAVPGDSESAQLIRELQHEVVAWRMPEGDPIRNVEQMVFRGTITQSQDTLSEQVMTTTFTCHDVIGALGRRFILQGAGVNYNQVDQDSIFEGMARVQSQNTTRFGPSADLGINTVQRCYPDGSFPRPASGRIRDRFYPGQTNIGEAIENLSAVIDGFDFGSKPDRGNNNLQIYYPYQGIQREGFAFVYGATVSSLTRSVNSQQYGNYVRVLGQSDEGQPQRFAEAQNTDATDLVSNPSGLWQYAETYADVSEQATLAEKAAGILGVVGITVPNYTLHLRPGSYHRGAFEMGDVVRLMVRRGRLDVDTWVRVIGITFVIGDDGEEDVEVEVGRPLESFRDLFSRAGRRVAALERR